MLAITDLPAELLDNILWHVDHAQSYYNLCLVDKVFLTRAEPYLYQRFQGLLSVRGQLPLILFMKRLVERPDLALCVESIELGTWDQTLTNLQNPYWRIEIEPLDNNTLNAFAQAAYACGLLANIPAPLTFKAYNQETNEQAPTIQDFHVLPLETDWNDLGTWDAKWLEALQHGLNDALVVLLVALCPKLKELFLHSVPFGHMSWGSLGRVHHGFRSLRDLTISGSDPEREFPLAGFYSLISAPFVQYLETYACGDTFSVYTVTNPSFKRIWAFQPHTLNISRLELQYCSLSWSSMMNLIQGCKALKYLYYSTKGVALEQFDARELSEILQPQKHSLETLKIDLQRYVDFGYHRGVKFGSFTGFTRLTNLQINENSFLDLDFVSDKKLTSLLPHSLTTLHLTHLASSSFYLTRSTLSKQFLDFPFRKKVLLHVNKYALLSQEDVEHIRSTFKEANIELEVHYTFDLNEPNVAMHWTVELARPDRGHWV